ncbi:hypothetical protein D3C79_816450 [compost metagenome]
MGGNLGEEQRNMVGQRLFIDALHLGENGRDGAVQRELDQYSRGGRYGTRHCVKKAARAPVQQGTEHDEQQVVGIQPGDRGNRRLGGELLIKPASGQGHQQQDQDRAVLQPLTRASALRCRWRGEAGVDAAVFGATCTVRAWGRGIGDEQRDHHQRRQHDAGLPEEDGFSERNHPGYRQD